MADSITDLKKGVIVSISGTPWRVTDYSQKVMGRGGSIVNVKLKNLVNGSTLDKTYKGNDSVELASVDNVACQYLYADNDSYFFMNEQTFETVDIPKDVDLDAEKILTEGTRLNLIYFDGRPISIDMPKNLELEVVEAEDVVRGNTSGPVTKKAKVSTGLELSVPQFIKTGDIISVDTASLSYRERIK